MATVARPLGSVAATNEQVAGKEVAFSAAPAVVLGPCWPREIDYMKLHEGKDAREP